MLAFYNPSLLSSLTQFYEASRVFCFGIYLDKRNYGPSLMKMNKQQQLENMIQKSAALKEMSASSFGRYV